MLRPPAEAGERNELLNRLVCLKYPSPRKPGLGTISPLRKAERQNYQTGSGMYHPIVKEQVLPGQLEGHPDKQLLYPTAPKSQPKK